MTTTEERLRGALAARAEQVQESDLAPRRLAARPHRPVGPVLLAAAVVLVMVAAGLLTRHLVAGDGGGRPARQPDTAHRLTGDVDGDGRPDVVRLDGRRVIVALGGKARTVHRDVLPGSVLVGLAGLGTAGSAIVVSAPGDPVEPGSVPARNAVVLRLVGQRLVETSRETDPADRGVSAGPLPRDNFDTFWVERGLLRSAVLVPSAGRPVPVYAWTYALVGGQLRATRLGRMCWDQDAEPHPSACRPGHDYRGPTGPLPELRPMSGSLIGAGESFTDSVDGAPVTVRFLSGPAPGEPVGRVRFSVTASGATYSATTPPDYPAGISTRLLAGDGGIAVVLRQETGDAYLEKAYVLRKGGLRPARIAPAVPLGEYFLAGTILRTWQTDDGGLYTALPVAGSETPGRVPARLWSWRLTGDRLVPEPLGIVCLPDVVPEKGGSIERCAP